MVMNVSEYPLPH